MVFVSVNEMPCVSGSGGRAESQHPAESSHHGHAAQTGEHVRVWCLARNMLHKQVSFCVWCLAHNMLHKQVSVPVSGAWLTTCCTNR